MSSDVVGQGSGFNNRSDGRDGQEGYEGEQRGREGGEGRHCCDGMFVKGPTRLLDERM